MSARPCRGPHRCRQHRNAAVSGCSACPPITSEPLCPSCRTELLRVLEQLPEAYVAAYLALERGQRYDVRAEAEHGGGRRGKAAHAPIPVDVEADALMRRILEVVVCWHEVVTAAVGLSGVSPGRRVTGQRIASRVERVVRTTTLPRLDDETERGEFAMVEAVQRVEAVDRPNDSTAGVAITSACRTIAAHVDRLLELGPQLVNRTVPHSRVLARQTDRRFAGRSDGPPVVESLGRPLLPDDEVGRVLADGRAVVLRELDGVDAALEILGLRRDVRRTLGLSRGATVFDRPCPSCDEPGLVLLQSDDVVRCSSCDYECEASDWRRLELVLKSSKRVEGQAS